MEFVKINQSEIENLDIEYKNIFQSHIWANFRKNVNNIDYDLFILKENDKILNYAFIQKKIKSFFKFAYIERGQLISKNKNINNYFINQIKLHYKKLKYAFISIDFDLYINEKINDFIDENFQNSFSFQPQKTIILDLSQSIDDILKKMKPKGRYNIKLAQKKGVIVKQEYNVNNFYNMLKITSKRDKFSSYTKDYYEKMIQNLNKNSCIFTAFYDNIPLASAIYVYFKQNFIYYYGSSNNEYRNMMAPYLLQFASIQYAKENGYKYFDLFGISTKPNDNLAGVTQFKRKFGGIEKTYHPPYAIPLSFFKFLFYKLYKKLK